MTVLDIVILTVIAACAIYGARQGLVRELSHIVAFGLGLFLAVKLHSTAARVILYRLPSNTAALAAFLGLLLLTIAAVYLTFSYFKSAADKLKLGPADHVAGAAFGAIQGTLVCTLIIFVLVNFSSSLPASYLGRSRVASFLLDRSVRVTGVFPGGQVSKFMSIFKKNAESPKDGAREAQQGTSSSPVSEHTGLLQPARTGEKARKREQQPVREAERQPRSYKVVHVFVALCDNKHQRIVRVPEQLGNGQDPRNNLYWGAAYGVKTFFARSPHWLAVASPARPEKKAILRRCVFRSKEKNPVTFVVADAYDGAKMRTALIDFLKAASGLQTTDIEVGDGSGAAKLQAGGRSDMVCFVGHNGLMDITLPGYPKNNGQPNPACAVVLACRSCAYFTEPLRRAKCRPLITTSGLMAPEAYVLDAIVRSWAKGDSPTAVKKKAGKAYAKYQRISEEAGMRLFVAPTAEAPQEAEQTGSAGSDTVANRVKPPQGFKRTAARPGSFGEWLRSLPLKPGRPAVLLYNGRKKKDQNAHYAVVDMDIGKKNLQQCADAVIRLRAEYLYSKQRFDRIHFNFTSGHRADFTKWAKGFRPAVNGSSVTWTKKSNADSSYESFTRYLETVFIYAGTASLEKELKNIDVPDMQIGDVFIHGGFPGHAAIVVDMARDTRGRKVFLLAQSYMPAQDIHILKNPRDAVLSPWYDLDFGEKLITPEWDFSRSELKRFK